jgi:hypothetical protein
LRTFHEEGRRAPVGVIGLGVGGLTPYAAEGQDWTFFELDPAIERVARDTRFFTYLSETKANLRVVLGDARLTLGGEPDGRYGLLIVDAFSSDAIPVHLMTVEAVRLYLDKLAPGGVLILHISNNYLDLLPVLDGAARELGLEGVTRFDTKLDLTPSEMTRGKKPSQWVLLARRSSDFGRLPRDRRWERLPRSAASPVWTDDFSNVWGVFRR